MKAKMLMVSLLAASLLCTGCSAEQKKDPKDNKAVETEKERGGIQQLNVKSFKEMLDKKNTFVMFLTQSTCSHCNNMKRTVVPYLREHKDLPFYEIELDMLGDQKSDAMTSLSALKDLVEEIDGSTPTFYYFNNGELKDSKSGEMSEIALNNFMIDCDLVKGEKQEEESEVFKLTSDHMESMDYTSAADKIDKKEDFYVYVAEVDRYNEAFSKKLSDYLKTSGKTVYMMNMTELSAQQPSTEEEYTKLNEAANKVGSVLSSLQYTPTIFHVKNGAVVGNPLVDNASEEDIKNWFEK